MLAIGRALVTNPRLLVMDEPSEGLAPAIIESMIETFQQLEREGLAMLLIEQNLGVATALAERQLIMVAGTIAAETDRHGARRGPGAAAALPRRGAPRPLGFPALATLPPIVMPRSILAAGVRRMPGRSLSGCGSSGSAGDDIAFCQLARRRLRDLSHGRGRIGPGTADGRGRRSLDGRGSPVPDRSGLVVGREADRVRERARRIVRHLRHGCRRHRHDAADVLDRERPKPHVVARRQRHRVRAVERRRPRLGDERRRDGRETPHRRPGGGGRALVVTGRTLDRVHAPRVRDRLPRSLGRAPGRLGGPRA